MSIVGRSSRTPFKHWILNSMLGKIVGAITTNNTPAIPCPLHIIDMCAGDGLETDEHKSSPRIITHHADFIARKGFEVKVTLIEKSPVTFRKLSDNLGDRTHVELLDIDAKNYLVPIKNQDQAVFIHLDPNHVDDLPITKEFVSSLTKFTTFLMTMGCNAGGVKRLSRDERQKWFDNVEMLINRLPYWHDAILTTLNKDASQWAYLLAHPVKWADQACDNIQRVGNRLWPNGVSVYSLRKNKAAFDDAIECLFLTQKERNNVA